MVGRLSPFLLGFGNFSGANIYVSFREGRVPEVGIDWVVPLPRMPVTTRIIIFLVGDP